MLFHHEGTKSTKETTGLKAYALALSHEIVGSAIEVHRVLGPGLLEVVYEAALCKELSLRGLSFERQISLPVYYRGETLDCNLKLDVVVERTVIIEVKAVERLIPVYRAQLLTYLKLQRLWLGLLINFNVEVLRDGLRRVLNG